MGKGYSNDPRRIVRLKKVKRGQGPAIPPGPLRRGGPPIPPAKPPAPRRKQKDGGEE